MYLRFDLPLLLSLVCHRDAQTMLCIWKELCNERNRRVQKESDFPELKINHVALFLCIFMLYTFKIFVNSKLANLLLRSFLPCRAMT